MVIMQNKELKILFSIPIHSENLVVEDLIKNIQKYVKHPIIVLHVNASFTDFDETISQRYNNVLVNTNRIDHSRFTSLLKVFASNFHFSEHIDYDYHFLLHSNVMFIKHGIENYIRGTDSSYYSLIMKDTQRVNFMIENSDILSLITREEILNNFAEGTHCSKEIFKSMVEWFEVYDVLMHCSGGCAEEVVIPSLCYAFSDKNKMVRTALAICTNDGEYERGPSIENAKKFLVPNNQEYNQDHELMETNNVFIMKRVCRSMDDPLRQFINSLP
jgi:hypothetical protein